MKKVFIVGIVILVILLLVPMVFKGQGGSSVTSEKNTAPVTTTDTATNTAPVASTTPVNSASAMDAYLNASESIPDGTNIDDGSYSTISQ